MMKRSPSSAVSPVIDVSHDTQGTLQVLGDASQYSLLRADASAISDSDELKKSNFNGLQMVWKSKVLILINIELKNMILERIYTQ